MPAISPLDAFLHWEKQIPDEILFRQPVQGQWKTWAWAQAGDEIRKIASGLKSLGLPDKSHIAILSKNCAQWIICDLAIMLCGYISVPIYPTLTAHSIKPILEHSDSKAIILGKLDDYSSQKDAIPAGMIRIGMTTYGLNEQYSIENFISQQQPLQEICHWQPGEVLTIIYTSGTTGNSKGVMHTVDAIYTTVKTVVSFIGLPARPVLFSYLPLSHIAERQAVENYVLYYGGTISFAESIETFQANVAATQPTLFFAVPRIWGKLREGILKKMSQKKLDLLLSVPILNSFVKKGIRKKIGLSKAVLIVSSSAPISVDILKWFNKIGILINQVYGMTEDCVYAHFETATDYCFGSVGKPVTGLKTKFGEDGELRVKSPGNMKGYYKEPVLTAEAFDEEGYLKTGDIAEYNKDGFLFITGRVKDQFKTDKGKYISPTPLEMKLLADPSLEMACVVGTGIPQPIGLITLSEVGKAKNKNELTNELESLRLTVNETLDAFEKLEKLVVMKENWTIENRLITPSLKVKRNEIEKIYLSKYPKWFVESPKIIWLD
jgi:long-chain acyl-CoA synthetase